MSKNNYAVSFKNGSLNKPNQDRVYGTKDTYQSPYSNTDMLDDHLE